MQKTQNFSAHEVLIQYLNWFYYGPIDQKDCNCRTYDEDHADDVAKCGNICPEWKDSRLMKPFMIPVLWIWAIVMAILLNRIIEEPMRKYLRPARRV